MRALVAGGLAAVLAACSGSSSSPEPASSTASASESAPASTVRPGEAAIRARWATANTEIERLRAEESAPRDEDDRERSLRSVVTRSHALALATIRRDEAENEFFALACPDASAPAQAYAQALAAQRDAEDAWLPARLEQVASDVALTTVIEDEHASDADVERATARADGARERHDTLAERVSEATETVDAARDDVHDACDVPFADPD